MQSKWACVLAVLIKNGLKTTAPAAGSGKDGESDAGDAGENEKDGPDGSQGVPGSDQSPAHEKTADRQKAGCDNIIPHAIGEDGHQDKNQT